MTTHDRHAMTPQSNREFMKEMRTRWAALPEHERALIDVYCDDTFTRKPVSEKLRWVVRTHFFLDDAHPTAAAWVADKRARDEQDAREARARDAERAEERRVRNAAAREAHARKLEEMRAALARGESVPARFRPVGGSCAVCRKPLQDPESVRLGIGPDCRRQLQKADAQRAQLESQP